MTNKNTVEWDFHAAFASFSRLKADEIGVLIQLQNLYFIHKRPMPVAEIKTLANATNIQAAKCRRIVDNLVQKGRITLEEVGGELCIMHKRTSEEVKKIQKEAEIRSKVAQNAAETRWQNEKKQIDSYAQGIPSTSTYKDNIYNTPLTPQNAGDSGLRQISISTLMKPPCSFDGYNGKVIKFQPDAFHALYKAFCTTDETKLRRWLDKRDAWYAVQPHKIQDNWLDATLKKLRSGSERV